MKDPVHLGREVLMIIDDDEEILAALGDLLQQAGYLVATAPNGRVALEQLQVQPRPSAFLVDLMMPDMNGWDFVAEMRAMPGFESTPVLVLTAGGDELLAKAPVASGYFTKPIAVDDLLFTLRRSLTIRPPRPSHRSGTRPTPAGLAPLRVPSIDAVDPGADDGEKSA